VEYAPLHILMEEAPWLYKQPRLRLLRDALEHLRCWIKRAHHSGPLIKSFSETQVQVGCPLTERLRFAARRPARSAMGVSSPLHAQKADRLGAPILLKRLLHNSTRVPAAGRYASAFGQAWGSAPRDTETKVTHGRLKIAI